MEKTLNVTYTLDLDMNVASSSKRSTTPLPQGKRLKTEESDSKYRSDSSRPAPYAVANGVERIPIPANVNVNRLTANDFQELIRERIELLRQQGRRIVGLPVVLNDGIVIHWVRASSDLVDTQPGQAPLNPEGLLWSQKADFHKTTNLPRRLLRYSDQNSEEKRPIVAIKLSGGCGTSAMDAITIDSDEERSSQRVGPHPCIQREASPDLDPSFPNEEAEDHSGSDIEFISWIRPADSVEDYPKPASGSSRGITPDLPPDDEPILESPEPPPRRPRLADDVVVASSSEQDDTQMMSLDSEDDPASPRMTREEVAAVLFGEQADVVTQITRSDPEAPDADNNDFSDIGLSLRRKPLPSLPSLAPIRNLLRSKRQRQTAPSRERVTVSRKKLRREDERESSPEAANSESGDDMKVVDDRLSRSRFKRVPLPKTDHGRARRLLKPESTDLPLVAITMRGDCHFLDGKKKFRITGFSLPNPGVFRLVEDCCVVGDTAVLGHDKGSHQISFLSFSGRPQMIDVVRSPHNSGPRYQATEKRGVRCLAAMHAEGGHIKFFSGGHDGTIHKWTASVGRLEEPRSKQVASLSACVTAMAYRDRDTSVVSSTQKKLHITDLNRSKTMTHLLSYDIHQIHTHPQAAYVTLLEVRHLDRQIQMFDSRKGHFDSEPCQSFGHRNLNGKFSGSHTRGSVHPDHFVRGSEDGCVILWDFRNSKRAVVEKRFQRADKVVHTIFADRDIATFGQGVVTFFEDYLAQ